MLDERTINERTIDAADFSSGQRQKLHRLSWLFVLLPQLGGMIVPLGGLLLVGSWGYGGGWAIVGPAIAAVVATLYSAFYTFTYRFWLEDDKLVVREGLLDRTLRHIALQRIQNISFRRTLLHRLVGVAEVLLESGAGGKAEAKLTVLPLARADALEQHIRTWQRGQIAGNTIENAELNLGPTSQAGQSGQSYAATEQELHRVPFSDLLRLGLISNRGMIVIGAGMYFLDELGLIPLDEAKSVYQWLEQTVGFSHGWLFWTGTVLLLGSAFIALVRLASIVFAILQFHGFVLTSGDGRIRAEYGLLTRNGGAVQPKRIVGFAVEDGWLHRFFDRQRLLLALPGAGLSTEVGGNGIKARGLPCLTPVAPPAECLRLLHTIGGVTLNDIPLEPLHPRAGRRVFKRNAYGLIAATLFFAWLHAMPWVIAALLILLPFAYWVSHKETAASGFGLSATHLVLRSGYFSQHTFIIPRADIHSVVVLQGPFDPGYGMASIAVDISGGNGLEFPRTELSYLRATEAFALAAALRQRPTKRAAQVALR
jgi:putative membrane protein